MTVNSLDDNSFGLTKMNDVTLGPKYEGKEIKIRDKNKTGINYFGS